MPDPFRPTVFLSYASQDAEAATRICDALRAVGVDVWLDQSELRGGDTWDAQIKKQIHDCSLFIPMISAHTNARTEGYFRREWNLAARRLLDMAHDSAFLVPVVIDETRETDARVPEEFLHVHWTRLPGGETPPAFALRVRQLLEMRGARVSDPQGAARPGGAAYGQARTKPAQIAVIAIAALAAALAIGWGIREWATDDEATAAEELLLAPVELPPRSVAVLAFENRGGSEGSGVLAEGIPETVLHQLGLLPGLTVIARRSSFAFRDGNEDLRVIGRKLNARYLLEGSVQAAGNRLRVTSSLVDAQTGTSVWSEQFDPKLEDLFAVQDEIALAVARALKLTLDAASDRATGTRASATKNYDAYFEFLRGRALLASVRMSDIPAAIEALTTAIRHDPTFSSPYVLLARAKILQAAQEEAGEDTDRFRQKWSIAMGLINEAIELDPQSGEAYIERGYLNLHFDAAEADTDMRRGLELAPNYARGYEGLASVLFQSVARRREALEMLEKARKLDPLDIRLDVLKATYLEWGPGDYTQADRLLQGVLERDPLFVPALVRLADVRWGGQGRHADSVALLEQAVALDPGNETAWRHLVLSYIAVGEAAGAESAIRHISDHRALVPLNVHLFRNEWRAAGEQAYDLIAAGPTYFQVELQVGLAIRRHARVTGDYQRAIKGLEGWASVVWDGDEPVLQGQLDMGTGVAGLADMLMQSGQKLRARVLLEELLAYADLQVNRFGRGEIWLNHGRALAYALLDRPDDAVKTLKRQLQLGFLPNAWRVMIEDEPIFDRLRERKDFQALLAACQAIEDRERTLFLGLRAEGRIPDRSKEKT
jgi:TolB-like protein/cytochrome c-type biogenesis protein CcmH/NrfG